MEGKNRTFLGDLSYQVLIALVAFVVIAAVALVWSLGVAGVILVVLLALGLGAALRFRVIQRVGDWRENRAIEKIARRVTVEMLAYMTHLRDVGKAFGRAQTDPPQQVRERIRREILEPVRGFVTTPPGCEVKVVWFRPDADGKHLQMYEQVGHTEEGERGLRLRIGGSVAGKAFVDEETFYSGDCLNDPAFQAVEKSKAAGSLVCMPISRGTEVTGVLSVLANWTHAFWVSDVSYFEALASGIGALESLEEPGNSDDDPI